MTALSRSIALVFLGVLGASCERSGAVPSASAVASSAPATLSASAAPSVAAPNALPAASASASVAEPPAPLSWVGVPVDPSIELSKPMEFSGAKLRLPADWKTLNVANGMSETDEGVLAYVKAPPGPSKEPHWGAVEKDAVLLITTHAAIDDSLLDYGAGARFGLNADAGAEHWDAPVATELGPKHTPVFVLRARGKLGGQAADLWQLRRKFPTGKKGFGWSLLVLGAVRTSASAEVRARFLASLASLTTDP